MEVKLVQLENAQTPIEFKVLDMVTNAKLEQPEKVYCPIDVTELGIINADRPVQP